MAKLTWSEAADRFPDGHLVAGILDDDSDARKGHALLARLLARLSLKGDYALRVSREKGGSEIHCLFEQQGDARRVAEALQASVVGRYPGYVSQREFALDRKTVKTIERALKG